MVGSGALVITIYIGFLGVLGQRNCLEPGSETLPSTSANSTSLTPAAATDVPMVVSVNPPAVAMEKANMILDNLLAGRITRPPRQVTWHSVYNDEPDSDHDGESVPISSLQNGFITPEDFEDEEYTPNSY